MSVEYPEMRQRLIGLLRETDSLDAASFDDWFNDLDWLTARDVSEIGAVLTNDGEANAVAAVRELIDAMFEDLGDAGLEAYRSDPRWPHLARAAGDAAAVIESA